MTNRSNDSGIQEQVRSLLQTVLGKADFPGCVELLQQAATVEVSGGPVTMLELEPNDSMPASAFPEGPVPLSILITERVGNPVGELLIWVEHGYLSALEFAWWTDAAPDSLPTPDQVTVTPR